MTSQFLTEDVLCRPKFWRSSDHLARFGVDRDSPPEKPIGHATTSPCATRCEFTEATGRSEFREVSGHPQSELIASDHTLAKLPAIGREQQGIDARVNVLREKPAAAIAEDGVHAAGVIRMWGKRQ